MRINFVVLLTIILFLSDSLWAVPTQESEQGAAKNITRLLEYLSGSPLSEVSYHYACQTSTGQYGLEAQTSDELSRCYYWSGKKEPEFSDEFTTLYLNEEILEASVEEFIHENSNQAKGNWKYLDGSLRYEHNRSGKTYILTPRNIVNGSGGGSGDQLMLGDVAAEGAGVDIGATIIGMSIVALAIFVIVAAIIEADRHCLYNCVIGEPNSSIVSTRNTAGQGE